MATTTRIEWADVTVNPVRGCSHCSPGCDHCYAERVAARLARIPNTARAYAGLVDVNGKWTGRFTVSLDTLDALSVKPRRIFVGSMCDLFHENLPYNLFLWIVEKLSRYPQHTFMLLTKRPERMKHFISLTKESDTVCGLWPLPNLWLGVTVCNQAEADAKIPALLATPAAKRFVSVEPMLGPVDLSKFLVRFRCHECNFEALQNVENFICPSCGKEALGSQHFSTALNWVICGGETGPGARPMNPDWVRGLRDQCQEATVPFFLKSWGEWAPDCLCGTKKPHPETPRPAPGHMGCMFKYGKANSGRSIDKRIWDEVPQ